MEHFPVNSSINCVSPIIILNPLYMDLILQHKNYTLKGKRYDLLHVDFNRLNLNPDYRNVSSDDINSCFISDKSLDITYPLYLYVRCGRCELCTESKVSSLVQRCYLETQMYNVKPIFLTLTYEKAPQNGVSLRDIQLFFKRLRITLSRRGYDRKVRYLLCAEYGKPTFSNGYKGRPHYHAILWNLGTSDELSYLQIKQIIRQCWNHGFIRMRQVDPNDDKGFRYTTKYLYKGSHTPGHCRKTFMVSSNRGGGIGSAFFRSERHKFLRKVGPKTNNLQFRNKWSNNSKRYFLDRYALDHILPSLSKSIPIRSNIRRFLINYYNCENFIDIVINGFDRVYNIIHDFFGRAFFIPSRRQCLSYPNEYAHSLTVLRNMIEDSNKILHYFSYGLDFLNECIILDKHRKRYVDLICQNPLSFNLDKRVYSIRRSRGLANARLVL